MHKPAPAALARAVTAVTLLAALIVISTARHDTPPAPITTTNPGRTVVINPVALPNLAPPIPPTTTTTSAPRATRNPRPNPSPVAYDGDRFDRLARCESGGDPTTNTGNGYFGAFQFLVSSWRAAGGTGYPHEHTYAEQKQIAMSWAARTNPYRQWPVCWPRSG